MRLSTVMRLFGFLIFILTVQVQLFGQLPEAMNYQAVARNTSGDVLVNQSVGIRFQFHQYFTFGTVVFSETHTTATNDHGLFSSLVGNGTATVGSFGTVDWSNGPYFLRVDVDPNGGSNYSITSIQQLLSVPYAMYAGHAETSGDDGDWSLSGTDLFTVGRNVGIGTTVPIALLDVRGDARINSQIIGRGTGNVITNFAAGANTLLNNINGFQLTAVGGNVLNQNTIGSKNTGVGYSALVVNTTGSDNVAVGVQALFQNSSGSENVAVGTSALHTSTTGTENVAIGAGAMRDNTIGSANTAVGRGALADNTQGSGNTGIGNQALRRNTTGGGNIAVGQSALFSNTNGDYNCALGSGSLAGNTTGSRNTALGNSALINNSTGPNNVAVGHRALFTSILFGNTAVGAFALENTTGNDNTAVGVNAGLGVFTGFRDTYVGAGADAAMGSSANYSTAIGENSRTTAVEQVRLGNNFTSSIGGYQSWTNISDGRMKKAVEEDVVGLDLILKLRPVSYELDHQAIIDALYAEDPEGAEEQKMQVLERTNHRRETGFIAQEVELVAEQLGMDFSGVDAPNGDRDLYGLRYSLFVVPLVKAVQEQQSLIEEQRGSLDRLWAEFQAMGRANIELMEQLNEQVIDDRQIGK